MGIRTVNQIVQKQGYVDALLLIVEPNAEDLVLRVPVEQKRRLHLILEVPHDRFDEVVLVQPVYDHQTVEGFPIPTVDEKRAFGLRFLPFVDQVVELVQGDVR